MPSVSTLKAAGLNKSPNQLSVPEGSLVEATNVEIRRDATIESRRGFAVDGDTFGSSSDRLSQLLSYKNRLLRHYNSTIQFEDGTNYDGTTKYTSFSGTYAETEDGLRIKSIESNGNLYFTTSSGIKRISAADADDLTSDSGFIQAAGGIKAVDVEAELDVTLGNQSDFMEQDTAVAYRVAWGYKDANNNLHIGTPSQRTEVYNHLSVLLLRDYVRLLGALDDIVNTSGLINDGSYMQTFWGDSVTPVLDLDSPPVDLQSQMITFAQVLDQDILYANDGASGGAILNISDVQGTATTGTVRITFSAGDPTTVLSVGSRVFLAGFGVGDSSATSINGARVLTAVNASYIEFSVVGVVDADDFVFTSGSVVSYEYRYIVNNGSTTYPTDLVALEVDTPATNNQLLTIQDTLDRIIIQLQAEPAAVIGTLKSTFITPLAVTTTANVTLDITVPADATTDHFYQVYRSNTKFATGTAILSDLIPDDEMQLVYEAYPTDAEISAKTIIFTDITYDDFRGAYLYTNEASGEGILQANDVPPFAKDINRFKNAVFYANTKTRHKQSLSILGVSNMVDDYGGGTTPKIVVSNGTTHNTYSFVTGRAEVSTITVTAAETGANVAGEYFLLNSAGDKRQYYVWYSTGATADPAVANRTGIKVEILAIDNESNIAYKTANTLNRYPDDFTCTSSSSTVTINNVEVGYTTSLTAGNTGYAIAVPTGGRGESVSSKEILLSESDSPAIAADVTARSMTRVINKNTSECIYVYYLSTSSTVPGQMLLEARALDDNPFYLVGNNENTGDSFNPSLEPTLSISTVVLGAPTVNVITTSAAHGLVTGDEIVIVGSATTPVIDGVYEVTRLTNTTFRINQTITVGGVGLTIPCIQGYNAFVSENENKPNRVYFSKTDQPEAVPALNYFDIGASNKEILRIFPLRDSLFVFKEDGLFRISGETPPYSQTLFDSSYILIAPDSLGVTNNTIYGWTTQGISAVTEAGASPAISRPLDTDILKLPGYDSFTTATFGIGYESSNAYIVWTVSESTDTVATIAYRYGTATNSWTTYDVTHTCALVNPANDKLYLGAGDLNATEKERKNFDRTDYADREYEKELTDSTFFGTYYTVSDATDFDVGDVIYQDQTVTVYEFNLLLGSLDADVGVGDSNYAALIGAEAGNNMRDKLEDLANKLDADSGVATTTFYSDIESQTGSITAISAAATTVITSNSHGLITGRYVRISGSDSTPAIDGDFEVTVLSANTFSIPVEVSIAGTTASFLTLDNHATDMKTCYNRIVSLLNADSTVVFTNYREIDNNTEMETVITAVNRNTKRITVNDSLNFIEGAYTLYKAIPCVVTYAPNTLGDPVNLKHMREATVMFENKAFTNATLSFKTDLFPEFVNIPFNGDGNGIFGSGVYGSSFFGGGSNGAPFRTYFPRNSQRCRYFNLKFTHSTARETWALFGVSVTGEMTESSRGYR